MKIVKLDQTITICDKIKADQNGIFWADYRIEWGRNGEYITHRSVYCYHNHDLDIDWMLRKHGLDKKRIKKVEITAVMTTGATIAPKNHIKNWKITNNVEQQSKD